MKVKFLKDHGFNKKDSVADLTNGNANYLIRVGAAEAVTDQSDNFQAKKIEDDQPIEKVEKAPKKEKKETKRTPRVKKEKKETDGLPTAKKQKDSIEVPKDFMGKLKKAQKK